MILFKKDLILEEDTTFYENIEVKGCIKGNFNLIVRGNIKAFNININNLRAFDIDVWDINAKNIEVWDMRAWDIHAFDINAYDINALDIKAFDISAHNIRAYDINACSIYCENRIKQEKNVKTETKIFINNRGSLKKREVM